MYFEHQRLSKAFPPAAARRRGIMHHRNEKIPGIDHPMNLFRRLSVVAAAACLVTPSAWACVEPATVCDESAHGSFTLVSAGQPATVLVDSDADPAVRRVAASFAEDLFRVSGQRAPQTDGPRGLSGPAVLIVEIGRSRLLDELVREGKLQLDNLEGRWEAFQVRVVEPPMTAASSTAPPSELPCC